MALHLMRGLAATMNLVLGGLLVWMWIAMAQTTDAFREVKDAADYLMFAALLTGTLASTGAAFLLLRRRTFLTGLQWHGAVGWSWLALSVGIFADNFIRAHSVGAFGWCLGILAAVLGSPWPAVGFLMRRLLNPAPAPLPNFVPVSPHAGTVANLVPRASSVPTQEATPVLLAQRH